ncbi:centrosomal protein of 162 kDa isoform X2 [Drosophila persimilis]|uniref:centrosomal protein of 162 kDa isoform X2 n=1 Tax=Drosophila persimilis TaxID=7234 RepID=UPI000F078104|nr:centrosomal protein of 162 kDa isoform X2 [Drosophila persimilis]
MSKVLSPQKRQTAVRCVGMAMGMSVGTAVAAGGLDEDLEFNSSSSIIDFLAKEQDCGVDADPESIFQEVSRLSDNTDTRSVDELLQEAERLIQQQLRLGGLSTDTVRNRLNAHVSGAADDGGGGDSECNGDAGQGKDRAKSQNQTPSHTPSSSPQSSPHSSIRLNTRFTHRIEHSPPKPGGPVRALPVSSHSRPKSKSSASSTPAQTPHELNGTLDSQSGCEEFAAFVDNLPSESVISEESTPKDMHNTTAALAQLQSQLDNTDDDEDTMEEMTEAGEDAAPRRNSTPSWAAAAVPARITTSQSHTHIYSQPIRPMASYSEKAVGSSPKHLVSTLTSPIEQIACSVSREHALKHEIEQLQEQLKDTEERLASVRLQSDSLSQTQRALRDHNGRLQEESEMLKLDVQHLNECAGVLRSELQAARRDRSEALQLQRSLRAELEEAQQERRRAGESKEKDARVIQDLQRQCREMERILMRKHPDSVSALIVASKSSGLCSLNDQENVNSRKLLEQRIAQLESDAKEQDRKAQQILANVQARFNSVQSKYETHIADLETQVLSLQEINTKLNEQIESQVRTLDRYMQKRADRFYNNCTQTEAEADGPTTAATAVTTATGTQTQTSNGTRDHSTNTIGCPSPALLCQQQHHLHMQQQQHSASSSTSSTANSTPNTSRPNSKQSGASSTTQRRPIAASQQMPVSKLPISQSDSTLSVLSHSHSHGMGPGLASKEESQLLSSVRGMRVDLAIKNKAMQRLTRELDDCKKTIRKLQRDRETSNPGTKLDLKSQASGSNSGASGQRRSSGYDHYPDHIPAAPESQALKEAQNKYRLLEADYKTLHDKRLQDLKTLQSAHERELATCNETVRILKQRLNEREEAFATQKRRKVPVDYYALKAKVSLLERRHSEREDRLHMLVEALSKGRLNGALEDLMQDNNNK